MIQTASTSPARRALILRSARYAKPGMKTRSSPRRSHSLV
jgi:hypothetical protein